MNLRVGDWVQVRTAEEILSTLDQSNSIGELPFMPEMLQYCGKRYRVSKSAHKTCDAVSAIRRMSRAVHLEDLRCDGEGHDGCQAGCLLFWKEDWLQPVDGGQAELVKPTPAGAGTGPWSVLLKNTRVSAVNGPSGDRYRCQATELISATTDVKRRERWDPRLYLRDLTSGNVTPGEFVWYGLIALFNAFTGRWLGWRYPRVCGLAGSQTPTAELGLKPGELVRVRTKQEIMKTLNSERRNRGMWFDVEAVPFCDAGTFKVLRRVERIIDEKTGQMIRLRTPAVILDGVACGGKLSSSRMFCTRGIYPYWREIWLRRADSETEPVASAKS
jgi:hypothetical protein